MYRATADLIVHLLATRAIRVGCSVAVPVVFMVCDWGDAGEELGDDDGGPWPVVREGTGVRRRARCCIRASGMQRSRTRSERGQRSCGSGRLALPFAGRKRCCSPVCSARTGRRSQVTPAGPRGNDSCRFEFLQCFPRTAYRVEAATGPGPRAGVHGAVETLDVYRIRHAQGVTSTSPC